MPTDNAIAKSASGSLYSFCALTGLKSMSIKDVVLIGAFLFFILPLRSQDIYQCYNGTVAFFSETPVENIDATSKQMVGALNVKTRGVFFKVKMTTFEFKKALMQEHFNENYVESDKYPNGSFNGSINEQVDLTKDGTYNVTATGKLTVHGVEKNRTIPATVVVKDGNIDITSNFDVTVADHEIKIPTIVVTNIAEVVQVKAHALMTPKEESSK